MPAVVILKSAVLFVVAGLCEIGGGYLTEVCSLFSRFCGDGSSTETFPTGSTGSVRASASWEC